MKTKTIFDAMEKAEERNYYLSSAAAYYPKFEMKHRRITRQKNKFRAALLRRMEVGDRAREALKAIEQGYDGYCPWCGWFVDRDGHATDCPRQLALEMESVK
jgi:rubrerythrin